MRKEKKKAERTMKSGEKDRRENNKIKEKIVGKRRAERRNRREGKGGETEGENKTKKWRDNYINDGREGK